MSLSRKGFAWLAALAALAPAGASAQGDAPLRLAPTGPWALDYADESCRLVRTFGTGDQEVTLGLTSYEPTGMMHLSAVGPLTVTAPAVESVRVRLGGVEAFNVGFLQVDFGGTPGIVMTNPISIGAPPPGVMRAMRDFRPFDSLSDPEVEAQVTEIGLVDGMVQEFVVETGSMRAPMQALKDCTRELVTHWNVDHAALAGQTRTPAPTIPPFRWLDPGDYPRELRQPTLINYRLIVDPQGAVAECHIAGLPPTAPFAEATCAQLREARFEPALDAQGNPFQSYYVFWYTLYP